MFWWLMVAFAAGFSLGKQHDFAPISTPDDAWIELDDMRRRRTYQPRVIIETAMHDEDDRFAVATTPHGQRQKL